MLAAIAGFCVAARLVVGVIRGDLHPVVCVLAFAVSLTLGFGKPSLFSAPRMLGAIAAFCIAAQMLAGIIHGDVGAPVAMLGFAVAMTVGISMVVGNWIVGIVVGYLATFAVLVLVTSVH